MSAGLTQVSRFPQDSLKATALTYRRLCQEDRYTIHRLLREGKTSSQIARALNFHPSTISKEIKRNSGRRGYRPKQAGQFAAES
jgi:IS30 family transposase